MQLGSALERIEELRGRPEGFVDGDDCAIECVKHGALFDLQTGEPITLPATRPVPVYEVEVVDGQVVLTIGEQELS